ncbi:hypothetical protein NDU88_006465 [Pleurodeles waltl]|uniref:Uncharacterized protein n=1 Tax=Pleurodeles waltl TaxID=8319 RepID=A0AAV7QP52_PLEWA|nr:hypothetical protein NDU88_006465 [Pleurodeles waltl]
MRAAAAAERECSSEHIRCFLQRAECSLRPSSPTWQTRCLAPASGALFQALQPHVADALPRSSEQSVLQGLTTPRVRRAASLPRAERFFFLKRSLPHVAVNTKAGPGPGPGFFIFEFPRLGNHKHVTVFSWAGPYCGLTFLGFQDRETTPHPSQSGARQPGLPP